MVNHGLRGWIRQSLVHSDKKSVFLKEQAIVAIGDTDSTTLRRGDVALPQ
jgi:hypothetical protein